MRPPLSGNTYGFSVYYTSARWVLEGRASAGFCTDAFLAEQSSLGLRGDAFCPSPPTMALLMTPVAWMPWRAARVAWIFLDLAFVLGIAALAFRVTRDRAPWWAPLGAMIVTAASQPLRADLEQAQVYTLLALVYTVWLFGYVRGRDVVCAAALAVLALAKLAGVPLWILMLARGRWKACGLAIGFMAAAAVATLPLFGLASWADYLGAGAWQILGQPLAASTAYQTLASLLRQVFVHDARWSPAPLVDAPALAAVLWGLIAGALLLATLRPRAAGETDGRAALRVLCLVVPLQPAGEQYHLTLLLAVMFVLIANAGAVEAAPRWSRAAIAAALVLLALPSYFLRAPDLVGWPWALLAYPRLYAALLLWTAQGRIEAQSFSARS